jgi:ribonuclease P protein component
VLPPVNRMTRSADFASTMRDGRRARTGTVVLHLSLGAPDGGPDPIVGLVVSKAVGNSVVRHRVSRRLRAQLADRLGAVPRGGALVVRALPRSSSAESDELGADLDRALGKVCR